MTRTKSILLSLFLLYSTVPAGAAAPEKWRVEAVKEYEHDADAYTQGLFFDCGQLYESTGQFGSSSFRKVDLTTGKPLRTLNFGSKYFAEGSVILNGKLYILTWTNKLAFVYDASSLTYEKAYSYPREGWGLTTDGRHLIASDGTSRLYYLDAKFNLLKSLDVRLNGRSVRYLNELEWIEGKIWANVYMTDVILIINPDSGEVEGIVNCEGLLPEKKKKPNTDVLNGIAYDSGKIYLTGKNWPCLYEVRLTK